MAEKAVLALVDLVEDLMGLVEEAEEASEEEAKILEDLKEDLLRCMMLPVLNVEKNVKFHLDLLGISLFFAVIVLDKVKVQAEVPVHSAEIDPHHLEYLQSN